MWSENSNRWCEKRQYKAHSDGNHLFIFEFRIKIHSNGQEKEQNCRQVDQQRLDVVPVFSSRFIETREQKQNSVRDSLTVEVHSQCRHQFFPRSLLVFGQLIPFQWNLRVLPTPSTWHPKSELTMVNLLFCHFCSFLVFRKLVVVTVVSLR